MDKVEQLIEAAKGVVEGACRYYTAGNGRKRSIEADDGEACEIVHSELITHLGFAVTALRTEPSTASLQARIAVLEGALKAAKPFVEGVLETAQFYADADLEGITRTCLEQITVALQEPAR